MIKKIISFLIFSGALQAQIDTYTALRISVIRNLSQNKISIGALNKPIESTNQMVNLFNQQIDIPFISIAEYIKDYAQAVRGQAYVPRGSLMLMLGNKEFGLWENEKGIYCSPSALDANDEEQWPKRLMPNLNKRKPKNPRASSSVSKLLLVIGKTGDMLLDNYRNFTPRTN